LTGEAGNASRRKVIVEATARSLEWASAWRTQDESGPTFSRVIRTNFGDRMAKIFRENSDSLDAAKRGNIDLITFLLKKGAIISLNKKRRTALLDAYTHNQTKIAKEITKFVIQRNTVRNIVQVQGLSKTDVQEQLKTNQLINDCIRDIKKNYLARNIFSRLMARHNEKSKSFNFSFTTLSLD
jgi:hypothetical protein